MVQLDPEQQAVVDFMECLPTESLMVEAKAGTGKTTTLLAGVGKLEGVSWLCAFGKTIAETLEYRIKQMGLDEDRIRVSTVHSRGRGILYNTLGRRLGQVDKFKVRKIVDEIALKNPLYRFNGWRICKMVELAKQAGFGVLNRVNSLESWHLLISHFGLDIEAESESARKKDWDSLIDAAVEVYNISLNQISNGVIDFSDMLLGPMAMMGRVMCFPQYNNILIDEAQDISPLRLALIMKCLAPGGRVVAIGDENQAIFGFAGADAESMSTIRRVIGAGDNVFPISVSYRCPKASVALVQQWVPGIRAHPQAIEGKHITIRLEEDPTLASQWLTIWDTQPFSNNDVILCRNTRPLVALANRLMRKQIPCYVEGKDFAGGLVKLAKRFEVRTLDGLERELCDWRDGEVEMLLAKKQNYKAEFIEDQVETLLVLIDAARDEGSLGINGLLAIIDRMFDDTKEGGKPRCITLSTIHRAKGKEWDRVFWLGRERYQPSKFAIQDWEKKQEKHLMYVAGTRNIKELIEVVDNSKPRRR